MTVYEYLIKNYKTNGEPIFLADIEDVFGKNARQYVQYLVKRGKIYRFKPGVYYLAYTNTLGLTGSFDTENYIKQKYISKDNKTYGYKTGYILANEWGITTQNPAIVEICSDMATTKQRKIMVGRQNIVIYQPKIKITTANNKSLQFLDFLLTVEKYSELTFKDLKEQIARIIKNNNIDIQCLKSYLSAYPDTIYKILYKYEIL